MKITASPLSGANVQGSGAIALYVFSGEPLPEGILSPGDVPAAAALLDDSSFRAKKGKIAKALLPGSAFSPLYLVGLGERKVFGEDSLRSSTAELVRRAKGDGVFRIFAHLPVSPDRNASCAVGRVRSSEATPSKNTKPGKMKTGFPNRENSSCTAATGKDSPWGKCSPVPRTWPGISQTSRGTGPTP